MAIVVLIRRVRDDVKRASGLGVILCTALATSLMLSASVGHANDNGQDISGGAGEGVKRPVESTTRRRPKSTTQPKSIKRTTKTSGTATQPKVDLSKQVDAALALGNAARDSNPPRYADAEQAYNLALGLDPEDARAHVGLGNTYFDQKRYSEAEASFTRAIQLDPQDHDAHVALAYTNNAQERYEDAERAATRATTLDSTSHAAFVALGWSKYKRKSYQEAETAYRRAIALSPKTPEIYVELSAVLLAQNRWRDSEPVLLQALTLDPSNAATTVDYAFVLHKLGMLDKAAETYTQATKLDSKAFAPHSNLALIQYTRGDFAKAREEWEAARRLNSAYALDHIGLMILDRKLAAAQVELEKYTQANAADEDGWLLLGDVKRMQNEQAGATAAYARATQIAPGYAQHARPTIPEPPAATPTTPVVAKSEPKITNGTTGKALGQPNFDSRQPSEATSEPTLRYATSVRTIKGANNAKPMPSSGAISVTSNPNAIVVLEPIIGGEALRSLVPASLTVVAFNQLRPGEYLVWAWMDGFEKLEAKVFVAANRIISVKLVMRPKS
jgi:tetratricopeptide (TPR) repeat protein